MKSKPNRRLLTQQLVLRLRATGRRQLVWDTRVAGLGVAVEPGGRRSYYWFRKVNRVGEWKTLGRVEDIVLEAARGTASEYNARVARGENPFVRMDGVTLGEAFEQYKERALPKSRHVKDVAKARRRVDGIFDAYLSAWRPRPLVGITRQHVRDLHAKLGKRSVYAANRCLQLLKAVLNYAVGQEIFAGENPAEGIDLFEERERDRYVTGAEMPGLFRELRATPNRDLHDFVVLDLHTGARKSDLLSMRWEHVDRDRRLWYVPEPKAKMPYVVALTDEACAILEDRWRRRTAASPWVFPNPRSSTGHVLDLKKSWTELRKRAGIPDVRQHDLRRTFGSYQAIAGASLPVIAKALGHKPDSLGATSIYARLSLDPIRESVMAGTRLMLKAARKRVKP